MRPIAPGVCELKRLYVRTAFRGRDVGRKLVERVVSEAKASGYSMMRLDTIAAVMPEAEALYCSLGFHRIPPYYDSSRGDVVFFELEL